MSIFVMLSWCLSSEHMILSLSFYVWVQLCESLITATYDCIIDLFELCDLLVSIINVFIINLSETDSNIAVRTLLVDMVSP